MKLTISSTCVKDYLFLYYVLITYICIYLCILKWFDLYEHVNRNFIMFVFTCCQLLDKISYLKIKFNHTCFKLKTVYIWKIYYIYKHFSIRKKSCKTAWCYNNWDQRIESTTKFLFCWVKTPDWFSASLQSIKNVTEL